MDAATGGTTISEELADEAESHGSAHPRRRGGIPARRRGRATRAWRPSRRSSTRCPTSCASRCSTSIMRSQIEVASPPQLELGGLFEAMRACGAELAAAAERAGARLVAVGAGPAAGPHDPDGRQAPLPPDAGTLRRPLPRPGPERHARARQHPRPGDRRAGAQPPAPVAADLPGRHRQLAALRRPRHRLRQLAVDDVGALAHRRPDALPRVPRAVPDAGRRPRGERRDARRGHALLVRPALRQLPHGGDPDGRRLPTLDDAMLLAALARALVATLLARRPRRHARAATCPHPLLVAAHWRAAHDGLEGLNIDMATREPRPGLATDAAALRLRTPASWNGTATWRWPPS